MKSNKIVALGAASLAVVALAACSNRSANRSESAADSIRVAYVTDTGGVDDKKRSIRSLQTGGL